MADIAKLEEKKKIPEDLDILKKKKKMGGLHKPSYCAMQCPVCMVYIVGE